MFRNYFVLAILILVNSCSAVNNDNGRYIFIYEESNVESLQRVLVDWDLIEEAILKYLQEKYKDVNYCELTNISVENLKSIGIFKRKDVELYLPHLIETVPVKGGYFQTINTNDVCKSEKNDQTITWVLSRNEDVYEVIHTLQIL